PALGQIDAVLDPDPDIGAHGRGHGAHRHLVAPGREDRPLVGIAEEAVRGAAHLGEIVGVRADPPEDAEDRLDEERRLDEAPVEKMREIVEVADIVALELEARATVLAQAFQYLLDVLKRVTED